MKLQHQFEEADSYLIVKWTGQWHLPDVLAIFDAIGEECKRRGLRLVLIEGENAHGPVPNFERFLMGDHIAKVCRGLRIAGVFQAEYINKFGENTAVNRGADVLATGSRKEALHWLLQR